jgi:hypothetical protein
MWRARRDVGTTIPDSAQAVAEAAPATRRDRTEH